MKKFLSVLCAFVLLLGAGVTLSACGKDGKDNTIKFDNGDYACIVQQDTVKSNSNLTEEEKESYFLKNSIIDSEGTGLEAFVKTMFDNIYITLNEDSIVWASYLTLDDMFMKTSVTIKAYSFDNNTLTFKDLDDNEYTIKKNDDGVLTCQYKCYYDFGNSRIVDNKLVFTVTLNFEKLTETSTKQIPTEESFYANKVVSARYKISNVTGLGDYFDSVKNSLKESGFSMTEEQFTKIVNELCDAKIVIFEDNTLYYSVNLDIQQLIYKLIPEMEGFSKIAGYVDFSTKVGYIYTISELPENKYSATYADVNTIEYYFEENGNMIVTAQLTGFDFTEYPVTYIFEKINEDAI